jgi:NAD+ kinase
VRFNLIIGIVSRTDKPEAIAFTEQLVNLLESKELNVIVESETAIELSKPVRKSDLDQLDTDFVITVGGDGTILRTAMRMKEPETPILGVNMGSRGFLTEVLPGEIELAVNKLISEDFHIERCVKLSSKINKTEKTIPDSLNEVLISSSTPSKTLDMRLKINGEHLTDIQADGVLISTPTGSTAYNLSAGGSILSPDLEAMILTVICPYSYFKSIAVPIESQISVKLLKPETEGLLIIDGRKPTEIQWGTTIKIEKSINVTNFVRFKSFYNRLERRLAPKIKFSEFNKN